MNKKRNLSEKPVNDTVTIFYFWAVYQFVFVYTSSVPVVKQSCWIQMRLSVHSIRHILPTLLSARMSQGHLHRCVFPNVRPLGTTV